MHDIRASSGKEREMAWYTYAVVEDEPGRNGERQGGPVRETKILNALNHEEQFKEWVSKGCMVMPFSRGLFGVWRRRGTGRKLGAVGKGIRIG